ncbi:TPA: hypothetical protein ACT5B2_003810 [Burkholderia cenocepacia]|uniref:Uncharacterized protein n=1 Tax=Burkholderia cenocepacia TaxID=95486 RepID=A0A1V2W345_9BURK|nr:hypothetical protein [Burkholderia cenocepacia]MBR8248692.1 hypothetical protein [Burkholderia cenocepacia]MBR8288866.1 hypothetical protein [Burkholderia cenocepacia]MBR8497136.1 hypothetical protein [Burkholderia cenocepacia]ONJ13703.1 hypothetical protein A8D83_12105 [Burkholderia cenocepacia]ONJ30192.1 hypothetical protein A8D90_07105 [Burkholderia cenocepacia]
MEDEKQPLAGDEPGATLAVELAPAPAAAALDARTDALIEAWFRANFHDSIVSRDTATFNHVRAAVDALKKEIAAPATP